MADGAPDVGIDVHASAAGSYRPPVFRNAPSYPPQTSISLPVHTAVWPDLPEGAAEVATGSQRSAPGS